MHSLLFYILLNSTFCILLSSCYSSKDLSNRNLSDVYRKSEQVFHPDIAVYHLTDTTSILYVKVTPKEFLYMRSPDDRFKASFNIHYNLLESYESTASLGTGLESYELFQDDNASSTTYALNMAGPVMNGKILNSKLLLVVNIADNNKNYNEDFFINYDNTGKQTRQSFFVYDKKNIKPDGIKSGANSLTVSLFKNYLSEKDSVRITYRNPSITTLFVKCYFRNFPLAATPFSFDIHDDFDYQPDSSFVYDVSDSSYISFKKEGFYHFQTDTTEKDGLTLFRFSNSFPSVTSPEQMIEAVRYLTTKKEFEEMKNTPSKKTAMDKFWFDIGGNTERTKMLIKKYYSRVQEANRFFTSHTEGWRTDRGMVYIIFGKPNNVYKSANAESWIYGTPNNALSLNFFFVRVNNPFTDNDYTLTREPIYESSWYRAVDVWRQGRAYNDN